MKNMKTAARSIRKRSVDIREISGGIISRRVFSAAGIDIDSADVTSADFFRS